MLVITNVPGEIFARINRHFPACSINKVDERSYSYDNRLHYFYDVKLGSNFWVETRPDGRVYICRIGCNSFMLYPSEFHHISFL